MAQVNAGRVRFVSRGEYNNTTQYYLFDLVNYEGSSYVAIGNTLGNLPTNTTYWQLIAEKGNVGSVGPVGSQGVGIASITKTSTEGLVDTYTITYTNGTTSTFQITNGEDGETPLSDFNALKADVEDLRDNQITLTEEGTNIHVDNAAKARLYEFELSKESSQETTTGKNLLQNIATSQIINGITFTVNKDGTVIANGTASSNANLSINNFTFEANKVYFLNGSPQGGGSTRYRIQLTSGGTVIGSSDVGSGVRKTFTEDITLLVTVSIRTNMTVNNLVFKPMIIEGETATEYEEYTGGQPSPSPNYPQEVKIVEGSVDVYVSNGETTNTYTINLGNNEIVGIGDYKDELLVDKSGNVSIEKNTAKIDSYNGETITTPYMSTTGGLDIGSTVYYGIDNPELINLNAKVDLRLFKGVNNITNSEDGNMMIRYVESIESIIDNFDTRLKALEGTEL